MKECPKCHGNFTESPTQPNQVYCSLTCANRDRKRKNAVKYLESPKHCKCCNEPIPYEKRFHNVYCSHKCAATITNASRALILGRDYCKECNKKLPTYGGKRKFCRNKCDKTWKRKNVTLPAIISGQVHERPTLKKYLVSCKGHICWDCGNSKWKDQPILLQLDHIDGNPGNDFPENLRLLCPNCHSHTSNYRNKKRMPL